MRIVIAAVGRLRRGPEHDLLESYRRRIRWSIAIQEIEEKRPFPPAELRKREATLLQGALPDGALVAALDEGGKHMTSAQFATHLDGWQGSGIRDVAFVIGGADGLTDEIRRRADLLLAFGRQTWPHMLVRAMLMEQIYRAQQILAGHPYHRG